MRAGACTVQQALTSEAASVLRHSLCLAKRRGHAQVTPLHVAATLLSSRASLLRRACLKSHPHSTSHPLQCRALELCFNVALNRLPTTPGPLLHGQPSLSNALIAALKRAQAHQRRGCIEQQQQQPLLAIKVELEQLIISILDDPSVSRVMREAGFSSTSVKNNLEDSSASSVWVLPSSSPSPTETHRDIINHSSFWQTHFLNCSSEQNLSPFSTQKRHLGTEKEEDFRLVLEVLLKQKRRNTVVVGDCASITEGLVAELMGRVERGEVPDELRSAHFIKFQFTSVSLTFMRREDVEMKVADLRRKVGSLVSGGGAIIHVGDLKWVVETSINERDGGFSVGEISCYNPIDHLVAEVARLLSDYSRTNNKVWLMATANYQTYMRCQMKQPSLETQWALQAVSVPSGGLGLSLHASSGFDSRMALLKNPPQMLETKPFTPKDEPDKLTCCAECTSNFEKDAVFLKSGQQQPSSLLLSSGNIKDIDKSSTHLPYWLQQRKADSHHKDDLAELRRKWNRLCHSLHHSRPNQIHSNSSLFNNQSSSGKSYTGVSPYSWWTTGSQYSTFPDSNSISFVESTSKPNCNSNFLLQFGSQQPRCMEFSFGNGTPKTTLTELNLDSLKNTECKEVKITLSLGNPLFCDSLKPLDQKREGEMNPQDLCKLLQENVPWQSETIPVMAEALLKSKSTEKGGTWLLIEGTDWIGKRRLARAIAESLCGSANNLVHMNMRRGNESTPFSKTLMADLRNHENCVVLIEEIEYADTHFIKFLSNGFKGRTFEDPFGREVSFSRAVFIVTTTSASTSYQDRDEKPNTMIQMKLQVEEPTPKSAVSNADCKRKAEWDLSNKAKNPKICHEEDASSIVIENGDNKKQFSRQSSSNTLDLNIQAEEEEDEEEENPDEFNTVPSDLTQETTTKLKIPHEFLELIENRFVFNVKKSALFGQMTQNFTSKLEGCFEEVCGSERRSCFSVDQMVLEQLVVGSGSFLASLFEKWLKDIFQTSLQTVKKGGKEATVRLSLGGKEENVLGVGFMGSNLPNTIQVAFKD